MAVMADGVGHVRRATFKLLLPDEHERAHIGHVDAVCVPGAATVRSSGLDQGLMGS